MMHKKNKPPVLIVNRLIVFKNNGVAYDQKFKSGVNIIRGDNGTGKSSIMDLIYYSLGAEVTEWTTEQAACTHTIVEASLSGVRMCLKREITPTGKSAMYIHDGHIDSALVNSSEWYRYPNSRSKDTHSYSQQIFELLGLPSHKTNESQNLTMHQIMRLMYVDQLTEATKLLKEDKKFDNSTIREAIGEYLLGIDNLEAHNLRQALIDANRHFDAYASELKAIYRFLGSAGEPLLKEQLSNEIDAIQHRVTELEIQRNEVRHTKIEILSQNVKSKVEEISIELEELSERITSLEEERSNIYSEMIDTKAFLKSLSFRKNSLEQSQLTNKELGDLIFKYCPACLNLLKDHNGSNCCSLCKTSLDDTQRHYGYMQMINEINFQIRESTSLIEKYELELNNINLQLPKKISQLDLLKREYFELVSNSDLADASLSEISSEIGSCRNQILHLNEKMIMLDKVESLVEGKNELNAKIVELKEELKLLEESTKNRKEEVYSGIEAIAMRIISSDGGYESAFDDPTEITFDFARDKMTVNGKSKFSASSMVIMKNSIRVAIFIYSVNDKLVRFPRFLLIDNIEDKGMTAERSQNFQRVIVKECDELESDYQIIFTTSMIDDELNKSDYVVGPFYTKGQHTLNINKIN